MKNIVLVLLTMALFLKAQAQSHNEANYDEAKVPEYTLPDVLKTSAGRVVKNKNDWEKTRRPEILKLYEDNVYGQMPKRFDNIRYSVTKEYDTAMNGRARFKEVLIEVTNNNKSARINLLLFIPKSARGPVPAFLLINNRPKENTDPTRGVKSEFWPAEMAIDSGYAIAAIHYSDMAPDNKDTYADAVLQLYPEQLAADNGMKAVGAWAWGASRVMDYFETDKQIDARKVAIVGHSRGGKASLWAAAQDQRFAICVTTIQVTRVPRLPAGNTAKGSPALIRHFPIGSAITTKNSTAMNLRFL